MPWITEDQIAKNEYPKEYVLWVYNGLDASITLEIYHKLLSQRPQPPAAYHFSKALQAPFLEMMRKGIKVDLYQREKLVSIFQKDVEKLQRQLDTMAEAVWGQPLNPNSPKQLKEFFYNTLRVPEVIVSKKGERSVSTNREALEKVALNFHAAPFVKHILTLRDTLKKLSELRTELDADGRMRTKLNIAGTETGRVSSSTSVFGTGTNLQNRAPELRRIFESDPGKKLAYVDLEQAESRVVALLSFLCSGKRNYLDACLSGDLHTYTAKLIWPDLPWTGDAKQDKAVAEQNFYREFSYRDMSKRGGHGTNYYGQPYTMAKHLHVPQKLIQDFQTTYFQQFPEIKTWHHHVARRLQTERKIITLLGRERNFLGRPYDDSTLREAIAHEPQSIVGDHLNLCLLRVWQETNVEILLQIHDAILFQYPEEEEEKVIPQVLAIMNDVKIETSQYTLSIPVDAQVGWNWKKADNDNPYGLAKWKGKDTRKAPSLLDRGV